MYTKQAQTKASVSINNRAKVHQRDLIDQAAEQSDRSRSEFILHAACREAEDVLLDLVFFTTDAAAFKKFHVLLNRPLPATDKLHRLLKTKAPWDRNK